MKETNTMRRDDLLRYDTTNRDFAYPTTEVQRGAHSKVSILTVLEGTISWESEGKTVNVVYHNRQ